MRVVEHRFTTFTARLVRMKAKVEALFKYALRARRKDDALDVQPETGYMVNLPCSIYCRHSDVSVLAFNILRVPACMHATTLELLIHQLSSTVLCPWLQYQ